MLRLALRPMLVTLMLTTPALAMSPAEQHRQIINFAPVVNPKGSMIDTRFDNAKKMSVQWDNDGPIDVLVFKTGDWEAVFRDIDACRPALRAASVWRTTATTVRTARRTTEN